MKMHLSHIIERRNPFQVREVLEAYRQVTDDKELTEDVARLMKHMEPEAYNAYRKCENFPEIKCKRILI